jgi:hypothetical protein
MKRALYFTCTLVVLIAFFAIKVTKAMEGDSLWFHSYGGSQTDFAKSVCPAGNGQFILAGQTGSYGAGNWDMWGVKVNSTGDTIWTQSYGGSSVDWANGVIPSGDGNFFMFGGTQSFGAGAKDMYLVKFDASGNSLWTHTYGGSGDDVAEAMIPCGNGDFLLLGSTTSYGQGDWNIYLVRMNSLGDTLWTKTYGGNGDEFASAILAAGADEFLLGGMTNSSGAGGLDMYLVRIDGQGVPLETYTYGTATDEALYGMTPSGDGGFLLAGCIGVFGSGSQDMYLVKVDAQGGQLWTHTYGGSNNDIAYSIISSGDGNFLLAGWSFSFGAGLDDIYLVKVEASGNELWMHTYGGPDYEEAYSICATGDGDFLLTGSTDSFGAGNGDAFLLKVQGLPAVTISLSPVNPPIQIPANGGSFSYSVTLANIHASPTNFDCWTMIRKPNLAWYGPAFGPLNLTLPATVSVTRLRQQTIPATAPPGSYYYRGYVGDYPSVKWDESGFNFTKLTSGAGASIVDDWFCSGEPFPGESKEAAAPTEFALKGVFPNPFNPTTTISFELKAAGSVSLRVYDTAGKLVSTLVEGLREAGIHEVAFNASNLPSGIYMAHLQAGEYLATTKMVLLK